MESTGPTMRRLLFEEEEHQHMGNNIDLHFPATTPNSCKPKELLGSEKLLRMPNGVKLSFGQIIALAGDFYGIPEQPIINPQPKEQDNEKSRRKERFIAAYNTLARVPKETIEKELKQILEVMTEEKNAIEGASKEGKPIISKDDKVVPSKVYKKLGSSLVEKWDTITGGKWIIQLPLCFGRIMKLASKNHDHFLPYTKDAYLTGHELALEKAKEAGTSKDPDLKIKLLEEAYTIDAFACHFLTDSFSSGHIRTPRIELAKETLITSLGNLLCKYMHDEDNKYGLRVKNANGDKWLAYGDGMFFNDESEDARRIAVAAVQMSVDQVFDSFLRPEKTPNPDHVTNYIPVLDAEEKNNYPMFQVIDGKVRRRSDINNLGDSETVDDWIAVTTIYLLQSYQPQHSV